MIQGGYRDRKKALTAGPEEQITNTGMRGMVPRTHIDIIVGEAGDIYQRKVGAMSTDPEPFQIKEHITLLLPRSESSVYI